jgi:murein tripeptide amidase MpaA
LPWTGKSESIIAKADDPWATVAETSDFRLTSSYDETMAYLRRLADASPLVRLEPYGRTPEGRPMVAVVIASIPNLTKAPIDAANLHRGGRTVLFAQAGIHAGEIDGKDAGLMLIRDLALGRIKVPLDHVSFVFVPIFNADGHERAGPYNRPNQRGPENQGWRTTARNLNLNRDYAKMDSVEMRAQAALVQRIAPDLSYDLHVTDGMDYQYDITYGFNGEADSFTYSPHAAAWLNQTFHPALDAGLSEAGHIPGPLINEVDPSKPELGFFDSFSGPKFSTGYGDLVHRPTILVENHSLKPYRQRVLGTYVLLERTLSILGTQGSSLTAAIAADQALRPSPVALAFVPSKTQKRLIKFQGMAHETYLSPATGRTELRWLGRPETIDAMPVVVTEITTKIDRPRAYLVPPTYPEVIDRLRLHRIAFSVSAQPKKVSVTMARLTDGQANAQPFEGHYQLKAPAVTYETVERLWPAGTVEVPIDQPLGDLAILLLDPASPEGFLAWGFFPEILQRTEYLEGYVMAPMAERMLAADPVLKAAFEDRIKTDKAFAEDSAARMEWFYTRSPYADKAYLLYPIGKLP